MKKFLKCIVVNIAILTSSLAIANTNHHILLMVSPGCKYCSEAESILDHNGIKYRTMISSRKGPVPKLYVDGKYQGTGVDAVQSWVDTNK